MIAIGLSGAALIAWLVLVFARDGFWRARERDDRDVPPEPATWPAVTAIVPARDEALVIAQSIGSLIAQDYPGDFRVILVDDGSSDETAAIARACADADDRLTVLRAEPLASGWTGKLAAVAQGVAAAGDAPAYLWLTDADIVHSPDNLRHLVARAMAGPRVLVSLMARLRCESASERALIPAFVLFFQMLYPFAAVNRPHGIGAAAGGCMLVERATLARAGGIAAIRSALIDDCALGALMKVHGRVWLGLTERARSIRPYDLATITHMIARSAYAQLGYAPLMLVGTLVGLALLFLVPVLLAVIGSGAAQIMALAAWVLIAIVAQPILRFYGRSPLHGLMLPAVGVYYGWCTFLSAWRHWQGRGGEWKGRAQAALTP